MANADVIKEYLVSLGFAVDEQQYRKATGFVNRFGSIAGGAMAKLNATVGKGTALWVSAIGSGTAALAALASKAADADRSTEKFARRMWMSEQNARSLNQALSAMGESMDSINDIAASPKLREQFFTLRADSAKYENADVDRALEKIKDIQFEFSRLQVFIENASRYIAYYMTQYLAKPMERIRQFLKGFNDKGVEYANTWGKRIGKFAEVIVRLGETAIKTIKGVWDRLMELPTKVKVIAGIIAGIGLIMAAPWLGVAAAITAVLLLLDDYYTYQAGGDSALTDLWEQMEKLKEAVQPLFDALSDLWDTIEPYLTMENAKTVLAIAAAIWGVHAAIKAVAGIKFAADTMTAIRGLLGLGGSSGAAGAAAQSGGWLSKAAGKVGGFAKNLLGRGVSFLGGLGGTALAAYGLAASGVAMAYNGYQKEMAETGKYTGGAGNAELRDDPDFEAIVENTKATNQYTDELTKYVRDKEMKSALPMGGNGLNIGNFTPGMANTTNQYSNSSTTNKRTTVNQDNHISYSPNITVQTNNPQGFANRMERSLRANIEQVQNNRNSSSWTNSNIDVE